MERLEALTAEVHRFVRRRVANTADAEDIAQQTLLVACTKFQTFRGENFRAWLLAIARHLVVDHYRLQRRFQFVEANAPSQAETEPALQTDPDAVQEICANRERLRCYFDCIAKRLPLEEQVAVLLADVHGHPDKDSAVAMGITLPSFKLLLHGARAHLHRCANGHCTLVCHPLGTGCVPEGGVYGANGGGNGHAQNGERPITTGAPSAQARLADAPNWNACRTCPGRGVPSGSEAEVTVHDREVTGRRNGESHCAGKTCCLGFAGCFSTKCSFGVNCRLGLKCCRRVPTLLALRGRLLEALGTSVRF